MDNVNGVVGKANLQAVSINGVVAGVDNFMLQGGILLYSNSFLPNSKLLEEMETEYFGGCFCYLNCAGDQSSHKKPGAVNCIEGLTCRYR